MYMATVRSELLGLPLTLTLVRLKPSPQPPGVVTVFLTLVVPKCAIIGVCVWQQFRSYGGTPV